MECSLPITRSLGEFCVGLRAKYVMIDMTMVVEEVFVSMAGGRGFPGVWFCSRHYGVISPTVFKVCVGIFDLCWYILMSL